MLTIVLAKLFLLLNNLKAQLLLGFLFLFNFTGCDRKDPVVDFTGNTWGTTYSIRLVSGKSSNINRTLIQSGVDSIFISIDDQMSTYKINSEISLFNQMQKNAAINISPDFANVINRSIHLSELTSGSIDITIFPAVLVWRRGRNDRKYKDIWEPPTDLDIIMEMEKVGFDKLKLNGLTLVKIKRGQMIDVNSIAKGWGVDQLYKYFK
ncbi:MAG: FAD:protein FMN transferase, partial [Candidatus Marinimicrobia bacterium]|nr:FAD:protein FMN transferase [Candidatus Neomarinimicrobiota bacterium]